MSIGDIFKGFGKQNITLDAMKAVAKEEIQEIVAEQNESKAAFINQQEEAINPFAAKFATKEKPIKASKSRLQKMMEAGGKMEKLLPVEQIKEFAGQFQRRNPELRSNVLVLLREYIKPGDSAEDILRKLFEFYPDLSLADEALEFLLETTEGEMKEAVQQAKDQLNKNSQREITAGRNISNQAREASEKGLGTPTSLRDLYRDITGNPRDSTTLFEELSQKYAFKELKKVVDFLLHSMGADMKSRGPSISRAFLQRLFTETRSLQAILGVYRFFKGRMRLMESMFSHEEMEMPSDLSFEKMAKQFMGLCAERYPSAGKVKERAVKLGIDRWLIAKIIALTQFRDAIREVAASQVYKSLQHRDELYMAILEALEDLEDELEELEEQLGREQGEGGGGQEDEEDEDEQGKKKKKK